MTSPVTSPVVPPAVAAPLLPVPQEREVDVVDGQEEPVVEAEVSGAAELEVSDARLQGDATLGEMFGGVVRREVVFMVENVGDAAVIDPPVFVGVGRSPDVEPVLVATRLGEIEPGDRVGVSVDLELPIASIGTYYVTGQVADATVPAFALPLETYPWGLIALNVLALGLLVWALRRRSGAAPVARPAGRGRRGRLRDRPRGGGPLDPRGAARGESSGAGRGRVGGGPGCRREVVVQPSVVVQVSEIIYPSHNRHSEELQVAPHSGERRPPAWQDRSVLLRSSALAAGLALAVAGCGTLMPGGNTGAQDLDTAASAGPARASPTTP